MIRAFVGLPLPETYQSGLNELRARFAPRISSRLAWTRPGNWHLTLKFLGNCSEDGLKNTTRALETVEWASYSLQAGQAGVFPPRGKPRVLWLGLETGAAESTALAKVIEDALSSAGFAPEERPFRPHLTLARVKQPQRDPWPELLQDISAKEWTPVCIARFVLWRSDLSSQGSKYTPLGEFPAQG